ncbi:Trp biosynthesis-associated membrane protein [Arthrobacter sp. MDT1-65]
MSADRPAPDRPAPGRLTRRGVVVLGIVVLALVAFGSTTQTWLTVRLPQDAVQTPDLTIPGSDASTPVTAFALVALAAALAVSIAGRVARWIIAVILVLSGVGIVLSAAAVALDPSGAAEPAIGTAIGISGPAGAEATATALPWLAVAAGVLLVLAAPWVLLAGRTWGVNRRYDAGAARGVRAPAGGLQPGAPAPSTGDVAPGVVPPVGTDLGVTTDPGTGGSHPAAADAGTPGRSGAGAGPAEADGASGKPEQPEPSGQSPRSSRANTHADEIDSWDELSRGNDPTG